LAVHAVARVDLEIDAVLAARALLHLVDRRGTEVLARVAVLFDAARRADVRRRDHEMARLILFVHRARRVDRRELVERRVAAGPGRRQLLDLGLARGAEVVAELLHVRVPGSALELVGPPRTL